MRQKLWLPFVLTALGVLFAAFPAAAAESCSSIASLSLPDTTILAATAVDTGPFSIPEPPPPAGTPARPPVMLPAFCRVEGVIKPAIKFEVWLPASNWNGNLQAVGNGGYAGSISYFAMIVALKDGYATASTDTGHEGPNAEWAIGHPELVVDYGYRAIHEVTVKAKIVIEKFYGSAPRLSFFNGCSNGGRQGLMESQRYPQDYDGILVGAPGNPWTIFQLGSMLWYTLATRKDEANFIPTAKLAAIDDATAAACDRLDGVQDGLIEDPRKCNFDPGVLLCKGAEADSCLTAKQVEALQKIYAGPPSFNGKPLMPPLMPGGERGWAPYSTRNIYNSANNFFKYMVYEDPNWDFHSFSYTKETVDKPQAKLGRVLDAVDYDIHPFAAHGGKMILYQGWSDPIVPPIQTINQYKGMVAALSGTPKDVVDSELPFPAFSAANAKAQETVRLFMAPGMSHCGGGDGPNVLNGMEALAKWVDKNQAPEKLMASHMAAQNGTTPDRTRPLCPYPQTSQYNGHGSSDDAANFSCKAPTAK
jgi:feruloyl esterase